MQKKNIALLIAHEEYQPIEYGVTKEILSNNTFFHVLTASDKPGLAIATDTSTTPIDRTIDQLNPDNLDGLFLIGGQGALRDLDTDIVHALLQDMMALEKPYGAICISARILAHAGVLGGKKATGWDGDHQLADIFKKYAVIYTKEPVTQDGLVVTATGPEAAKEFALKIEKVVLSR